MASFNKPSILNEIDEFKDCEVAFFTTFNYDISFFEKSILPTLSKNKTRICIFADSKKLKEAIAESTSDKMGSCYYVHPFVMDKTFHPKLILLLKKDSAKLIVSSANLTHSSYYANNEIFQAYAYNEKDNQYVGLITEAFDFFKVLANKADDEYIDEQIKFAISNYPYLQEKKVSNDSPTLLTSYYESIANQLTNVIADDIKTIKVAVPFYDEDLAALKYLKNKYKNANINLYVQDCKSTFPLDKYSEQLINNIQIFKTVNNNTHDNNRFYHGKVFSFASDAKEYALFGSANFSASALLRSYVEGGNIEASILVSGEIGFLDNLFNSFKPLKKTIRELEIMSRENDAPAQEDNIIFVNGQFKNLMLNVHLKSNTDISSATITIQGLEDNTGTITNENSNHYLVTFKLNEYLKSNIFNLSITIEDETYIVRCFACNIDSLYYYLNSTSYSPFKSLNSEEAIENYSKDLFLKQLLDVTNDIRYGIQNDNHIMATDQQLDVNVETIEDAEEENDEEEEPDWSLYETFDNEVSIGNPDTYRNASSYLNHYAAKALFILSSKQPRFGEPPVNSRNKQISSEERKQKRRSVNKMMNLFDDYSDLRNKKLDNLNFDFYYKIYEAFSESFICDMYVEKAKETNVLRLVTTKINYLNDRLFPSVNTDVLDSDQFAYIKKEVALLCLESYQINTDLPQSAKKLKDMLINMDKYTGGSFISDIETLMIEVGDNLNIANYQGKIDYFKRYIIDAPTTGELYTIINDYFFFNSSSQNESFDTENTILEISIDSVIKRESFQTRLNLHQSFADTIKKYVQRKYEKNEKDRISFIITIAHYSDYISLMRYEWDSNNPRRTHISRTNAKTGIVREEDVYLI